MGRKLIEDALVLWTQAGEQFRVPLHPNYIAVIQRFNPLNQAVFTAGGDH